MSIRKLISSTGVLLIFTSIVILPASPAGMAEEKDCAKTVIVTDGADTFESGQLRTAIEEVCQGGKVEIAPSVVDIWVGLPIVIDKNVKVSGTGQTIDRGSRELFDVSTDGVLHLTGFTLKGGPSPWPAITVEGTLILKNVTVTQFTNSIVAEPGSFVSLKKDTLITGNFNYEREGGCGIYNDGGTVELFDNASVTDNVGRACYRPYGLAFGGGIFSKNGGYVALHDNTVVSRNGLLFCDAAKDPNWATNGGGIFIIDGTVTLDGYAQVSGNWGRSGGGIRAYQDASLTLQDNAAVIDNYSEGSGGGITVSYDSQLTMKDFSTISGNIAGYYGGGVNSYFGLVTLEDYAQITGNSASNGGGVYSDDGSLVVADYAAVIGNTPNDVIP